MHTEDNSTTATTTQMNVKEIEYNNKPIVCAATHDVAVFRLSTGKSLKRGTPLCMISDNSII